MNWKSPLPLFVLFLLLTIATTLFAPLEKTLGAKARIVYLHGAWVWVALFLFLAAALAGLAGLISGRQVAHRWSRALGRTGLLFWLAFLPMSLYVMQSNWNGLFLDEPRFRTPLNFAIVGLLLQVGLSFFPNPVWTSLANLVFGLVLFVSMSGVQTILHPESPIFNSDARSIQFFFFTLFLLLLGAAWQVVRWWMKHEDGRRTKFEGRTTVDDVPSMARRRNIDDLQKDRDNRKEEVESPVGERRG